MSRSLGSTRNHGGGWASLVFAVSVVLGAAWIQQYRASRCRKKNRNEEDFSNDNELMPTKLENSHEQSPDRAGDKNRRGVHFQKENVNAKVVEGFEKAASRVKAFASSQLSNGDRLLLYALFKQTTMGDAPAKLTCLSWNTISEHAKISAWIKVQGMKTEEAAARYIAVVEEIESRDEVEGEVDEDLLGNSFAHAVSRPAVDNGGHEETSNLSTPETKFLQAASENNKTLLECLLNDGVDVTHADASGETALHLAADKGSLDCLQALLEHGANVNATDQDGISVLQAAVIAGQVEICRLLLQHGARPDQEDGDGDTPRSCAADDGSKAMKRLFRSLPSEMMH
jgi:acyl-CoA-binding protein